MPTAHIAGGPRVAAPSSPSRRPLAAVSLDKSNHPRHPPRPGKELHAAAVAFGEAPPTTPAAFAECVAVLCELQEWHAHVYRGRLDIATLGSRIVARSFSAGGFAGAAAIGATILSVVVPRALRADPGSRWWALHGSVSSVEPPAEQLSSG